MVKLNFFSLVNLLLEKSVQVETGLRVKELVQEDVNAENIVAELVRLQEDFAYKSEFIEQLKRVKALFSGRHASQNVVSIISEMAGAGLDCG